MLSKAAKAVNVYIAGSIRKDWWQADYPGLINS